MKALIVGGYGFIGSNVAKRLHKEGFDIAVIDNLSTGSKERVKFKHESYILEMKDEKCFDVFSSKKFDVLIYLAATKLKSEYLVNSTYNEVSKINEVEYALKLAHKNKISKVIVGTSAIVYEGNVETLLEEDLLVRPTSFEGVEKHAIEQIVNTWISRFSMNITCLRFSNVYGINENSNEINSEFIDDYIYISDVADAVYKCCSYSPKGSVNITYGSKGNKVFSNKKASSFIEWRPIYTREKGLAEVERDKAKKNESLQTEIEEEHQTKKISLDEEEKRNRRSVKRKNLIPYIENLLAFLFALSVEVVLRKLNLEIKNDIMLIYIIVIGIYYGLRQSSLAVFLAIIYSIIFSLQSGIGILSILSDVELLIHFSTYVIIGVLLGYTIERQRNIIESLKMEGEVYKEKIDFLYVLYEEGMKVREELQNQIIGSDDSFLNVYNTIEKVNLQNSELIFDESVATIESIMNTNKVLIYTVDKNQYYLRLTASSLSLSNTSDKSIKINENIEIENMIETNTRFCNRKLKKNLPLFMAPIIIEEKCIAVIMVKSLEFEELTLYKENLFGVVIDLMSGSLFRAYNHERYIEAEKYYYDNYILNEEYFMKSLKANDKKEKEFKTPFTLVKFKEKITEIDLINLSGLVREKDNYGVLGDSYLYLILANANIKEASYAVTRFNSKGIEASIVEEGDIDDLLINYSHTN